MQGLGQGLWSAFDHERNPTAHSIEARCCIANKTPLKCMGSFVNPHITINGERFDHEDLPRKRLEELWFILLSLINTSLGIPVDRSERYGIRFLKDDLRSAGQWAHPYSPFDA